MNPADGKVSAASLARALVLASAFVGFVLVFVPVRILDAAGPIRPSGSAAVRLACRAVVIAGAGVALWCVMLFATYGRGTPAPFDPPRRLVVRGPYRCVRNPMYLGAVAALAGAAGYYASPWLLAYAAAFLIAAHLFVVTYEERILQRSFGREYADYAAHVRRWIPGRPFRPAGPAAPGAPERRSTERP